jgi:hypothetical protein
VGAVLALVLTVTTTTPAFGAVSVSRAEVSGSTLRIEGSATASRDITVDGVVMGRSDSGGRFKVERSGYSPPPDCTVDVNDGSATPRAATLSGCTVSAPPPPGPAKPEAPALLSPAAGASVTVPVRLAWSQVLDPTSLNGGYNWQVSASSTFATLVTRDSTTPSVTEDTVGGLAAGTYFWQVQAVNGDLVLSDWSAARSFTVTGSDPGALPAPTLDPLPFGAHYFPMEHWQFTWSAVPGAASYTVEVSDDPAFPAPVDVKSTNEPDTTSGFTFGHSLIGTWHLRVYAVDSAGVAGAPSNVRTFTVSYDAPIGPPPTPVSPAEGATLALPVTLDWNDVENPQNRGYHVEIASDPGFQNQEVLVPSRSESQVILSDLSAGTKYWRVRHAEGDASPDTAAFTAFSATRSFTVASGAAAMSSLWLGAPPCSNPCPGTESLFSGQEIVVSVQLTAVAPAGGAVVSITSSNPAASGTHPSSVTVPAGTAYTQFRLFAGQVSEPTEVTLTGTLGSSSASAHFTVKPTTVERLSFCCDSTGGFDAAAHLKFTGEVPPGGAVVSLASDSPLARPPATVTAAGGSFSMPIAIPTSEVTATTTVTISATHNGTTVSTPLKLYPQQPPTSVELDRTSTTGTAGATGTVRIAAGQPHEVLMRITSSHPDIATPQSPAQIGYLGVAASFSVATKPPAVSTDVTISATGAGQTVRTTLTVHPTTQPPPTLTAPTLLSPANGARWAPGVSRTFDWSDVSGAGSYTLQVSSSSAFTSVQLDRQVTASQVALSFASQGTRYWRVRAAAADGSSGPWSATGSFRIKS